MKARSGKHRWVRRGAVIAVAVALVATFPAHWGPWLVERAVCAFLPHGHGFVNSIDVRRVSLFRVEVGEVVLGGIPARPSFAVARAEFSPLGLIARRIDAVRVEGITFDPEYKVPNFAMASSAHAGARTVNPDPLQGWTIRSMSATVAETDLGKVIPPDAKRFLRSTSVTATLRLDLGDGAYMGRIEGEALGGSIEGKIGYSQSEAKGNVAVVYSPRLSRLSSPGDASLSIDFAIVADDGYRCSGNGSIAVGETALSAEFSFNASPNGSEIKAAVKRREVTEADALVRTAMSLPEIAEAATAAEFTFSAKANTLLTAGVTNGLATWTAIANLRDGNASFKAGDLPVSLGGVSASVAIRGLGAHFDIDPIPISFTNAVFGTVTVDSGHARLISDTKSLVVSEAEVGFCGGSLRLYSVYLSYERLNAGFTVFIDGIEVEPFLKMFPKLASCTATGRLYGRLPVFILGGGQTFRFGGGFLYAPPGDIGRISIEDEAQVRELLGSSGLPADVSRELASALRNLEYDILRFDLSRGAARDADGKLAIRVRGESRVGKTVTPVDVNISVNGALERALNLAVRAAKMKR